MPTKSKPRPVLSDEERAGRRARDREYARQAVEQLQSSEGWQAWLSARRYFHSRSLGNQLLIAMQHPTATRVAGFRAWLKLGYAVQRRPEGVPEGGWAIRIWAPCPPSAKQLDRWRQAGADPTDRPRTFFKMAAVFAQDQVQPLPPPAVPAPLEPPIQDVEGDELADTLPRLVALAGEIGSQVEFRPVASDAHGFYEPGTRRIVIDDTGAVNGQVKTFCHELAHALVRADRQPEDPELGYAGEEMVAELVAFSCLGALGINSESYSVPYLASWAEKTDLEILERTAGLIDRLASRIEDAVLASTEDRKEHAG